MKLSSPWVLTLGLWITTLLVFADANVGDHNDQSSSVTLAESHAGVDTEAGRTTLSFVERSYDIRSTTEGNNIGLDVKVPEKKAPENRLKIRKKESSNNGSKGPNNGSNGSSNGSKTTSKRPKATTVSTRKTTVATASASTSTATSSSCPWPEGIWGGSEESQKTKKSADLDFHSQHLSRRNKKPKFLIPGASETFEVHTIEFDSAKDMIERMVRGPRAQKSLITCKTYGFKTFVKNKKDPKKLDRVPICEDYDFKDTVKPSVDDLRGKKIAYATEHIFEYQILKKFIMGLRKDADFKDRKFTHPGSATWKAQHKKVKTDKDGKIKFMDYLLFWWGSESITYSIDGKQVTDIPMNIIIDSIPGLIYYEKELVLLDAGVNHLKMSMFSPHKIRDEDKFKAKIEGTNGKPASAEDALTAIETIKNAMFVVTYMQYEDIDKKWKTCAKRIDGFWVGIETQLAGLPLKKTYNDKKYQKLGLQKKWRAFVHAQTKVAVEDTNSFLTTYIPLVEDKLTKAPHTKATQDRAKALIKSYKSKKSQLEKWKLQDWTDPTKTKTAWKLT